MVNYKHLSLFEREEISRMLAQDYSLRAISRKMSRSVSTVSREIKRFKKPPQAYRAIQANKKALKRAHTSRRSRKLDNSEPLRQFVFEHLHKKWSPEQIAKELRLLYPDDMIMRISPETIYQYIYVLPRGELKKQLAHDLRRKRKFRRPRKGRRKSCPIQDYLSIEERPTEVADRTIPGHWEGDLIVGRENRSVIGTLVERTTRFVLLVKLKERDAVYVRNAFARKLHFLPASMKRSLTYDQGQEMAEHKLFVKITGMQVYSAHPHSPWERGTNENTNGLIRDFFPKGTDFNKVTRYQINKVEALLNERPRKTLNWRKPVHVFNELLHL